ncbi:CocE/NonD family hydrolase [Glacieibacterium sp.]|uniref:CocE/NonD family hydrolase n=1 Tax=Glacieibacterium sp. TaxID=2860237 RepID=UPI003B004940
MTGRLLAIVLFGALSAAAPVDTLQSDLGTAYRPATAEQDYIRREAMIPMRDGVRLYTLILMRKGIAHAPILLERTPYGADGSALHGSSQHLAQRVPAADAPYVEDGYIRVWQDVRGRYRSEGVYVTNRPLSGPLNPTGIDHATDTYDTLEWLTRQVPESNGKVGVIGGSYDGFLALMATLSGHPALKAAVPINPMVDVWMGDDWFHNGAFRQVTLNVLPLIMATKGAGSPVASGNVDLYASMLEAGSAGNYMRRYGLDAFPAARRFVDHPAYDAWWSGHALDRLMAARPIVTPMLLVAGQYDEQDSYGAPAVFRALHPLDRQQRVSLLVGPWAHMGVDGDGSGLGDIRFAQDTAASARRVVIKPFLDARLKDGATPFDPPAVTSYATGAGGGWHGAGNLPPAATRLYLRAGGVLSSSPPRPGDSAHDDYLADPARPVGNIAAPFLFGGSSDTWKTSLIADQRFAAHRPDVLTYVSPPLDKPVHVFGQADVALFAASTGTDADFVVKLIDVYPDENRDAALGGYQLPMAMEIFRARYRQGLDRSVPLTPGRIEPYRIRLPVTDHIVAKGHRIMVQVQSSWFPMYDRNPQTYVSSIFNAAPADYRAATQSVFHDPLHASAISLPIAAD